MSEFPMQVVLIIVLLAYAWRMWCVISPSRATKGELLRQLPDLRSTVQERRRSDAPS